MAWILRPLGIFVGTRIVVFLIGYVGINLIPVDAVTISHPVSLGAPFVDRWLNGDLTDYWLLSQRGYWIDRQTGVGSPSLLPVFPFLMAQLGSVAGGPGAAALWIANLSSALALILMYRWASEIFDRSVSARAIELLALFPYAFLFAAADPRSLELLLVVVCLYCMKRQRFLVASAAAAVGALTMPVGLALWPALFVAWINRRDKGSSWIPRALGFASLALVPLSLAAFALYLHQQSGFTLRETLEVFAGDSGGFLATAHAYLAGFPSLAIGPRLLVGFNVLLGTLAIIATPAVYRGLGLAHAVFHVFALVLVGVTQPGSFGPAIIMLAPLFVILATWTRFERAEDFAVITSALFLALLTCLFVNSYAYDGAVRVKSPTDQIKNAIAIYHVDVERSPIGSQASSDLLLYVDDSTLLLGDQIGSTRLTPGATLPIDLHLYSLQATNQGYLLSARLTDRAGTQFGQADKVLWGSADASLFSPGQSTKLAPGHYYRDALSLHLASDLPTGVYTLELAVFRLPSLASVPLRTLQGTSEKTVRLANLTIARPEDLGGTGDIAISHPDDVDVGTSLSMVGDDVKVDTGSRSGLLEVTLYWKARTRPDHDYTVFVQLLDPSGKLVSQSDSYPAGDRFPTTDLLPGEILRDVHVLRILRNLPGGRYRLIAGMYRLETGQRLSVTMAGRPETTDHLELPSVSLP